MGIRFSFRDALSAMTNIAAGTLQGKLIGQQQQLEQQQREQQMRAQSLAPMMQHLDLLDPVSRAQVLGGYSPYVQTGQAGPPRNLGPFQGPMEQPPTTPAMPPGGVPMQPPATSGVGEQFPALRTAPAPSPAGLAPPGSMAPPAPPVMGIAPQAPPPAAPTPDVTEFPSVFGKLRVRGIDPKAVDKAMNELYRFESSLPNLDLDPQVRNQINVLLDSAKTDIDTPEELAALRNAVSQARRLTTGAGPRQREIGRQEIQFDAGRYDIRTKAAAGLGEDELITELPDLLKFGEDITRRAGRGIISDALSAHRSDIQAMEQEAHLAEEAQKSGNAKEAAQHTKTAKRLASMLKGYISSPLTPDKTATAVNTALKLVENLTPAQARGPAGKAAFEGLGIGHLWKAFTEAGGQFGGKDLEDRYQKAIAVISSPGFAKLNKSSQAPALAEAAQLAKLTGRDLEIPTEVVARLDPDAKMKLALLGQHLKLAGLSINKIKQEMELGKLRIKKAQKDALGKEGKLTDIEKAQVNQLQKEVGQARMRLSPEKAIIEFGIDVSKVDLDRPHNIKEQAYVNAVNDLKNKEQGLEDWWSKKGEAVSVKSRGSATPATTPAAKTTAKPGGLEGRSVSELMEMQRKRAADLGIK
jgi:hypothetical protein